MFPFQQTQKPSKNPIICRPLFCGVDLNHWYAAAVLGSISILFWICLGMRKKPLSGWMKATLETPHTKNKQLPVFCGKEWKLYGKGVETLRKKFEYFRPGSNNNNNNLLFSEVHPKPCDLVLQKHTARASQSGDFSPSPWAAGRPVHDANSKPKQVIKVPRDPAMGSGEWTSTSQGLIVLGSSK